MSLIYSNKGVLAHGVRAALTTTMHMHQRANVDLHSLPRTTHHPIPPTRPRRQPTRPPAQHQPVDLSHQTSANRTPSRVPPD